jgi:DNA-binding IclR family transcriptional regulator
MSLSDLIAQSGLGKPTVRRLMLALIRSGLVEQDSATRLYLLGEESYVLGTLATPRHGLLEIAADAVVRQELHLPDQSTHNAVAVFAVDLHQYNKPRTAFD